MKKKTHTQCIIPGSKYEEKLAAYISAKPTFFEPATQQYFYFSALSRNRSNAEQNKSSIISLALCRNHK